MKYESLPIVAVFLGLAIAAPTPTAKNVVTFNLARAMVPREVPQEHSHNRFLDGVRVNLNLNNPNQIQDPVFGLLGNAAAAAGAGKITNLDCLHQATADQAFTNAKAAGNVTGQADALIFAALERNTGKVGQASVLCTETAVNPEIAAISQHQDPASTGAAAINKKIVLALAQQLAAIGADPQLALLSGTFAPGDVSLPQWSKKIFTDMHSSTTTLARATRVIPLMMLRVVFSRKIFSSMTLLQLKSLLPLPALLPLLVLLLLPLLLRILLRPLLEKHACVTLNLSYFHD